MTLRTHLRRAAATLKTLSFGERFVRRNPVHYPRARRIFEALMRANIDERRRWSAARLERVLRMASRRPYGRRVHGSSALHSWPLLEAGTVRENPARFQAAAAWSTIPASTGGTTGTPLQLARSASLVAVEQAALDIVLAASGVEPASARVAVLRGDDVKAPGDTTPPFWRYTMGDRRLVMSSNHLNAGTVQAYVRQLERFSPDYAWVYPSALEALCALVQRSRLNCRVPLVVSSSEVLGADAAALARDALACRVTDYYGQAERVAFAYALDDGRYRFMPGYAHVELLERETRDDDTLYEIVGTTLWNTAMTLVRYRTGDLVRLPGRPDAEALEAIALGVEPFGGIIGRDGDVLVAPDGTRLTGMDHIHRDVTHVLRVQIAHATPADVEVRVLPATGFGDAQRNQLLRQARAKIPESMTVTIAVVDCLQKSAAGKTPFIVRGPGVPGARTREDA